MNPFLVRGGLSPRASLNRQPLGDFPGILPSQDGGVRTAFPAFSGARLEEITRGVFVPESWTAGQMAEVRDFGRLFGRIVASLVHPTERIKDLRREWGAAEWELWAGIRKIHVAGGIFEGAAGVLILNQAREYLQDFGFSTPDLEILPWPSLAGMTGAALGSGQTGWVAAVDAGQTRVKRGWVLVGESAGRRVVKEVRRLVDVPSPPGEAAVKGQELHRWLVSLLDLPGRESLEGASMAPEVALSLANYLPGGRPEPRGLYGLLAEVGEDYPTVLSRDFGKPVRVFHDGTAAAFHLESGTPSAVIVAGTALGVGFA